MTANNYRGYFSNVILLTACSLLMSCSSAATQLSVKTIYITIDDAPLSGIDNILSAVEEENVSITLFMVGEHILASDYHQEMLAKAKQNSNILVGNHSNSHAHEHYQQFYSSSSGVLDDMQINNRIIGLSEEPFYSRLPGRDVFRLPNLKTEDPYITQEEDENERIDFDTLYDHGFFLYGWDLEWSHETSGEPIQTVDKLLQQIDYHFTNNKTQTKNHLVLLMHDQMFADHLNGRENLSALFKALKEAGYKLSTLDQYPINQNDNN